MKRRALMRRQSYIKFVGRKQVPFAGTATTIPVDLTTLTGGIGSSPIAGDRILVFVARSSVGSAPLSHTFSLSGFSAFSMLTADLNYDTTGRVFHKSASGSETTVNVTVSGSYSGGAGLVDVRVFRNADIGLTTTTEVTGTARCNPPYRDVLAGGGYVFFGAGSYNSTAANRGFASADLDDFQSYTGDASTADLVAGSGHILDEVGGVNPAQFTLTGSSDQDSASTNVGMALVLARN